MAAISQSTEVEETSGRVRDFARSHKIGTMLYTMCQYLCLNNSYDADLLFRTTIILVLKKHKNPQNSPDVTVLKDFHKVWLKFAADKAYLKANSSPLKLDWKMLDARQAEWMLYNLTPEERMIILYRLLMNLPLNFIQQVVEKDANQVLSLFHAALKKVS